MPPCEGTPAMPRPRKLTRGAAAGATLVVLVFAAGCTRAADDGDTPTANASAAQQVQATAGTTSCTPEKYNGGVPKLDLKTITVGFAQSEKEANPSRITET